MVINMVYNYNCEEKDKLLFAQQNWAQENYTPVCSFVQCKATNGWYKVVTTDQAPYTSDENGQLGQKMLIFVYFMNKCT